MVLRMTAGNEDVSAAARSFVDRYRTAKNVRELVEAMANDMGAAAFSRADYRVPLVTALIELCERMPNENDRIADVREHAESYGYLMTSVANIDGLLSSYTRAQAWPAVDDAYGRLMTAAEKLVNLRK